MPGMSEIVIGSLLVVALFFVVVIPLVLMVVARNLLMNFLNFVSDVFGLGWDIDWTDWPFGGD